MKKTSPLFTITPQYRPQGTSHRFNMTELTIKNDGGSDKHFSFSSDTSGNFLEIEYREEKGNKRPATDRIRI